MNIDKYTSLKPYEITDTDFTILGFQKNSGYSKGRKTFSEYLGDENEVVVKKTFMDILDETTEIFKGIHILFEWFNQNGEVEASKEQEIFMDNFEASVYLQKRRERAIGYLSFSAKGTPIETYLNTIFDHYKNEIGEYKTIGSDTFSEAVENETNPQIIPLLNIEVPRADGEGKIKVKDSILIAI